MSRFQIEFNSENNFNYNNKLEIFTHDEKVQ